MRTISTSVVLLMRFLLQFCGWAGCQFLRFYVFHKNLGKILSWRPACFLIDGYHPTAPREFWILIWISPSPDRHPYRLTNIWPKVSCTNFHQIIQTSYSTKQWEKMSSVLLPSSKCVHFYQCWFLNTSSLILSFPDLLKVVEQSKRLLGAMEGNHRVIG